MKIGKRFFVLLTVALLAGGAGSALTYVWTCSRSRERLPVTSLENLLQQYGWESEIAPNGASSRLLSTRGGFAVWLREAKPRVHVGERHPPRGEIHVLRGIQHIARIRIDALANFYEPQCHGLGAGGDGILVLSYLMGPPAWEFREAEYRLRIHFVSGNTCKEVLEIPFRPVAGGQAQRLTMSYFRLIEDLRGRVFLMRMKGTNALNSGTIDETLVRGEAEYVWSTSRGAFLPVAEMEAGKPV